MGLAEVSYAVETRDSTQYVPVKDSGYPTREVLLRMLVLLSNRNAVLYVKTASPEMFDLAPNDLPWYTGPS